MRRTGWRFTAGLVTIVLLGLATGLAGVLDIRDRAAMLDQAGAGIPAGAARQAPADAALDVYHLLADADAKVTGGYLLGGSGSRDLHVRYRTDIARATAALTVAAATTDSTAIAELSTYLPVYVGQVEDAVLASVRPGLSSELARQVGAAALREPAMLARERLLPAAKRLYEEETARLSAAQTDAATLPWLTFVLGVALVACLIAMQVYLKRKTKRLLNIGLVAATAAAAGALVWLGIAVGASAGRSETSRDSTARLEAFVAARITGLEARSDEVMYLISTGNGSAEFDQRFNAAMARLTRPDGLLARARTVAAQPETAAAVDAAAGTFQRWLSVHDGLRDSERDGRHQDAVALATDTDEDGAAGLASTYDMRLGEAVNHATTRLRESLHAARQPLSPTGTGVVLLMSVAVLGAVAGMWRRITEYR